MKRAGLVQFTYAVEMAIAGTISYLLTTELLGPLVDRGDSLLGGMWAAVAAVFVFRETSEGSVQAGLSRLIATCVSFALCSVYVALFPVTALGVGVMIAVGAIAMVVLWRPGDIITANITTVVVLGVAAIDPERALGQPVLRLVDTLIGIGVGVLIRWLGSIVATRIGIDKEFEDGAACS